MRSKLHPGGRRRSRHARSTVASRVVLAFLALMLVPGTPSAAAADVTGVATGVESSTTSRQPLSRQAELQGGEHLANIAPRRRLTQQNEASGPVGRYVKLIVDDFLHFNEMIVYPPGDVHSNAAAGKTVTASDVGYGGSLAGLVDGDIRGATAVSGGPPCVKPSGQDDMSHTCPGGGYFHSYDDSDNWVMVDLGEEIAIGGIFLYQTEDMGGFFRALGLYAEILDASQNTVLTTAPVQDSRAGYLLDFSPTRPNYQRGRVTIGQDHLCAFMNDGSVQCWGRNALGQLGDGTTADSLNPVAVQGITNALSVDTGAGRTHQCALLMDGSVKCWGGNYYGTIGDGTSTGKLQPTAVVEKTSGDLITDAVAISVADYHSCVVRRQDNLSVWCWGWNGSGQHGDGSRSHNYAAVKMLGISNARSVAVGYAYTCVLLQDGFVKCLGNNAKGQLGDGSYVEDSTTASQVVGVTNATNIASGYWHACALLGDGNVTCWGNNANGQLGNGATGDRSAAVQVSGITSAMSIALGHHHSCALLRSGVIKCWGKNANGQLGDGTMDDRSSPVEVVGITDAIAVAAGYYVSCAVLANEEARCWGRNTYGELGDGSTTDSSIPVSTTYTNQWRGLNHVYEVGDTLDGWKHFVDGFTYDFTVNVENYALLPSSLGPAIYSVSLDGVLPITDQFTMHVPPDRGVCAGYVACTAGQIGFIDNDNLTNSNWHSASSTTGTKLFSITSKTSISRIEITYARPIYAPGWLIQENGVEIFRENSNRGDSEYPEPVMYSYDRPCDTSAEPENGGVGDCPISLPSGSSCQPTCDEGYIVSGVSSCSLGTLTTATCDPAPCDTSAEPENGGVGDCTSSLASGSTCQPTCDTGYTVSGPSSCSLGVLTAATCEPDPCDASTAPSNGGVGDCTSSLASGSTCQPTCDTGYTVSGPSSCSFGTLTAATCEPDPCTASSDSAKNGSDGTFWCINGGSAGGTTGTCTCTSCATRYGGKNCHIGPCDMEKSCFDFNVRNGMTTPASCAFLGDEDVTGCRN